MGIFERGHEKKKEKSMTKIQKIRQNYAIINYYKKKNSSKTKKNSSKYGKCAVHNYNYISVIFGSIYL